MAVQRPLERGCGGQPTGEHHTEQSSSALLLLSQLPASLHRSLGPGKAIGPSASAQLVPLAVATAPAPVAAGRPVGSWLSGVGCFGAVSDGEQLAATRPR
jgi:hypothetical protein